MKTDEMIVTLRSALQKIERINDLRDQVREVFNVSEGQIICSGTSGIEVLEHCKLPEKGLKAVGVLLPFSETDTPQYRMMCLLVAEVGGI